VLYVLFYEYQWLTWQNNSVLSVAVSSVCLEEHTGERCFGYDTSDFTTCHLYRLEWSYQTLDIRCFVLTGLWFVYGKGFRRPMVSKSFILTYNFGTVFIAFAVCGNCWYLTHCTFCSIKNLAHAINIISLRLYKGIFDVDNDIPTMGTCCISSVSEKFRKWWTHSKSLHCVNQTSTTIVFAPTWHWHRSRVVWEINADTWAALRHVPW
jgi:hypothetical protein